MVGVVLESRQPLGYPLGARLNYGGGAGNNIPNGESWKHVVGPVFVYFNSLDDPKDLFGGVLGRAAASPALRRVA